MRTTKFFNILFFLVFFSAAATMAQTPVPIPTPERQEGSETEWYFNMTNYDVEVIPLQPYAELSDDGKTLTFKYGEKPEGAYSMNSGEVEPACLPEWHTDGSYENITKVVFDESFKDARPVSCYYWFNNCQKLTEIQGIEYLNTSEVQTMFCMFDKCYSLTSIDFSHFDTRKVHDMFGMFKEYPFTVLDLSSFDMTNVSRTAYMFQDCKNLTTIIVGSGWKSNQINNSIWMFKNCKSLIGNDGTTFDEDKDDKTNAHADAGGYLTEGDYKIFYKWADDETGAYHAHTQSTYNSSTTPLTVDNPADREGYTFLHWTRVSAKDEQIGGSSASFTITANEVGNRIYKMHWAINQYDVEFETEYGDKPETQTVNHGEKVSEPTEPTVASHEFQYWQTADNHQWDFESTVSSSLTLTAVWQPKSFAANFYYNETSFISSVSVVYGSTLTPIETPTKPNHKFLHWAITDGGEKVDFDEFTMPAEDVNFYAQWKEFEIYNEITDNSTGGKTLVFKYGDRPDGAYKLRNGNTVPDWYMLESYITIVEFDETLKHAKPTSCYRWFMDLYNVTDFVGWQYLNTADVKSMESMFSGCTKLTYLDLTNLNTQNVETTNSMFSRCSNLTTILIDNDKWKTSQIERSYSMFEDNHELLGNDGTKYTFKGTRKDKAHTGEGGYLTSGKFKIFYNGIDDDETTLDHFNGEKKEFLGEEVTLVNPEKEGYTFDYWVGNKITKTAITETTAQNITITADEVGNRIYTAHWTINEYAANFYYDESSFISSLSVVYSSTLTPIDDPEKPNSRFLHWAVKVDDEMQEVDFETFTMPSHDVDFYAQWNEKKNPPTVNAASDLVYSGAGQQLVTIEGEGKDEMNIMYKLVGQDYSTEIPEGLIGEYVVYYKAAETENYKSIEENSLTVEIKPAPLDVASGFVIEKVYDGTKDLNADEYADVTVPLSGFVNSDDYAYVTAKISDGVFSTAEAGICTVALSFTLSGTQASNYTMSSATVAGYIRPIWTVTFKNGDEVFSTASVVSGSSVELPSTNPTKEDNKFLHWGIYENSTDKYENLPIGNNTTLYAKWEAYTSFVVLSDNSTGTGKTLTFKYDAASNYNWISNEEEIFDLDMWGTFSYPTEKITKVVFEESFQKVRPTSCWNWFRDMTNLEEIVGLSNLNTSEVTNMSDMFWNCGLTSIDLSSFNTGNVTDMCYMFAGSGFTTLDLSNFNIGKVTRASYMFSNCEKLTTIKVGEGWKFGDDFFQGYGMFDNCPALIGNYGATVGETTDATYAHAGADGYLTTGDYKIFYKWADETGEYKTHTPTSFSGTTSVTLDEPEREGHTFDYWQRISAQGTAIGATSTSVTIAAGDLGNRIYKGYWTINKYTVNFYNGSTLYTSKTVDYGSTVSDEGLRPEKEGYVLQKWTLTDSPTATAYGFTEPVMADMNLYAQWFKDNFLVMLSENMEFVPSTGSRDGFFEFESDAKFKMSDGYKASEVYYMDDDNKIVLEPDEEGIYTYKVPAKATQIYYEPKKDVQFTVSAKTNLIYNGSEQTLVTVDGEIPEKLTVYYKVDNGEYKAELPTATNAKDYVVWYKADETKEYNSIAETSLTVTISPKNITPEITLSETEFVYDGTEKTPEILSVTYDGVDLSGEYSDPIYQNNVKVGTATVTISNKKGGNYVFMKTTKFTIKPIPFEYIVGKRARVEIPVTNDGSLSFSSDNSEVNVVLRDAGYFITTTRNVKKGDVAHIKSNITDITVTVTDPFENFFDDTKWYTDNVVLSYPENTDGWTLSVPDYENFTISAEGKHDVKCQIVDNLQNLIAEETYSVKIDKTAPELSARAGDYDIALNESTAKNYFLHLGYDLTVEATDEISGTALIQYSWDGKNFSEYNGGIKIPENNNVFYLQATDVAGNATEICKAEFTMFKDSKFSANGQDEITSDTIFYSSKSIHDMSFSVDLNGNTIGAITDSANHIVNLDVSEGLITVKKDYLETLLPGQNPLTVHINPLGRAEAWDETFNSADYEAQFLTLNLDVQYVASIGKNYSFQMEDDSTVHTFCQGDYAVMKLDFDDNYSAVDYVTVRSLGIENKTPDGGIKFQVPFDTLRGGNERLLIEFYKDSYVFDDTIVFPVNYPSERNMRVYDDVLAIDNYDGEFMDGGYEWYVDNRRIEDADMQFLDLRKYKFENQQHIFSVSVLNREGIRFRVCPNEDFIISDFSDKTAFKVTTYPNPAVSGQEFFVKLEGFSLSNYAEIEILIFNQLGSLVERISEVQEETSVVLPTAGFYSGVVVLRGQKVLNFKIVVE